MDLKMLCEMNAVGGDEKAIRKVLIEECEKRGAEAHIDRAGNVVAFKKGTGDGQKHVLFDAHMDEVGFIIMDANEEGLLLFRPVGSIDPRVSVSKYVVIGENKVKGVIGALAIHLQTAEDMKNVLGFSGLYIDIGAKDKEEALAACPPGSYAYFDNGYEPLGDGMVVSKALDDRVGCYNLLRILDNEYACDVTCVFATMEEINGRGAAGAGYTAKADTVIVLEGTAAGDMGDVEEKDRVCEAGKGVAISFMDKSTIADQALYREMIALAEKEKIAYQIKGGVTGSNDAGPYQRSAGGKRTCVLSVPCRYIHGPSSVAKLSDIDAQYELAKAFACQA